MRRIEYVNARREHYTSVTYGLGDSKMETE